MTLHHRTAAFKALIERATLEETCATIFNTKKKIDVIVFASSGTGAMEGAVSNLLSPGERVLIGTAGKFGERWVQLAKAYGIESVVVEAPYGHPVPIDEMKRRLEKDGPFRAVFIQKATESSTGVRNDVETLGKAVAALLPENLLRGGCDYRAWHHGHSSRRVGHRYHDRRFTQEGQAMIPPGAFFCQHQRQGRAHHGEIETCRAITSDYAKERKSYLSKGESSYTPATFR